jgi:hypothetical protein
VLASLGNGGDVTNQKDDANSAAHLTAGHLNMRLAAVTNPLLCRENVLVGGA